MTVSLLSGEVLGCAAGAHALQREGPAVGARTQRTSGGNAHPAWKGQRVSS